VISPEAELC